MTSNPTGAPIRIKLDGYWWDVVQGEREDAYSASDADYAQPNVVPDRILAFLRRDGWDIASGIEIG